MKKIKFFLKKIILILVPNSYIKRRHFHHSTYYRDKFFVMVVFNNNFFRNLILRFLTFFKNFSLSESLYYKLFVYQKATLQEKSSVSDREVYEIDYGKETRKSYLTSTSENINFEIKVKNNQKVWIGFALLEHYFDHYDINNFDLDIEIILKNSKKEKIFNLSFPVDSKKHGVAHIEKGKNWTDISLDLEDFENSVNISIKFNLIDKSFLMFAPQDKIPLSKKLNNLKKIKSKMKGIAISKPISYYPHNKTQKIFYISCESLTDPFWLEKIKYTDNINFKNIKALTLDSTLFNRSYSVADSTMPNILSVLSGLSPMQHGFGDYNDPGFYTQINSNIKFLPEILKKKNFTCAAYNVYGRFEPLYGITKGFDIFSQTKLVYDPSAPGANKLNNVINFFKDQNIFIYTHINRLHGPMINNGDIESPSMQSAESLSNAANYKFENLYVDQLKNLDDQLGQIINYLKSHDLYDNTTLIITGDHGAALPPDWNMGTLKFPHYEHHARVPLIIKYAKSYDNHEKKVINYPISSQLTIFKEVLNSQNLEMPEYFNGLFQETMKNLKFSITETIYHPNHNNYGISLVNENKKLFKLFKIDWQNFDINQIEEEKFFSINEEGIVDETKLLDKNSEEYRKINNQLVKIINDNMNFLKKYNHTKLPMTIEKIL
jgi:hypothetical protein